MVVSLKGEVQLTSTLDQLEDKMVKSLGGSENYKQIEFGKVFFVSLVRRRETLLEGFHWRKSSFF